MKKKIIVWNYDTIQYNTKRYDALHFKAICLELKNSNQIHINSSTVTVSRFEGTQQCCNWLLISTTKGSLPPLKWKSFKKWIQHDHLGSAWKQKGSVENVVCHKTGLQRENEGGLETLWLHCVSDKKYIYVMYIYIYYEWQWQARGKRF